MTILVYGMNHQSAPLAVRERVAFLGDQIAAAIGRLIAGGDVEEGLILSTCNRTEIVVSATSERAGDSLEAFLSAEKGVTSADLRPHCYTHVEADAVRHVLRTAASLDSMVIGEPQILGQVKQAYGTAVEAGGVGTILEGLLQRAFKVAKRVRSDTGIARTPVSVAHVAADLARDIFGDLRDNGVLILGAGKMSRIAAQHLIAGGVRSVVVASRSFAHATTLAEGLGGRAVPFDRMLEEVERADIVITSTAAPQPILGRDQVQRISRSRRGRPLFLIDIAVPRDVDPEVNTIDNVYLYDIDDLQGLARANLEGRRRETDAAEAIVESEVEAFLAWRRTLEVGPTIVELRRRIEALGQAELQRHQGRLAGLGPEPRRLVEEIVAGLTNKFLHPPTVALKHAARTRSGGLRVRLLREIFGLDGTEEPIPRPAPSPADPARGAAPAVDPDSGAAAAVERGEPVRREG
jgi:glutamyl-tRNA reductase